MYTKGCVQGLAMKAHAGSTGVDILHHYFIAFFSHCSENLGNSCHIYKPALYTPSLPLSPSVPPSLTPSLSPSPVTTQHLEQQQGALSQLVKVVKEDLEDLKCIEDGFSHA